MVDKDALSRLQFHKEGGGMVNRGEYSNVHLSGRIRPNRQKPGVA